MSGATLTASPNDTAVDLRATARRVAAQAQADEEIEVVTSTGRSTSVRAYGGEVESLRSGATAAIGIRVVRDGRQGFASAGSLDDDVVASTLAAARENLPFASVDEHQGIAQPDGAKPSELTLADPSVLAIDEDAKVATALELERRCVDADSRITGVRVAAWSDHWTSTALVSTAGVDVYEEVSSCSVGAQPIAADADGKSRIGYGGDAARNRDALRLDHVVSEAVEDTLSQLGAAQPASTKVTALLVPEVVDELLDIVASCLTASQVQKGRSPFAERTGEAIAVEALTLGDDPLDAATLGATNYDGEGLAARTNTLIDRGTLTGFVHNSYTARRSGTASTGSAVRSTRSLPSVGVHAMTMAAGNLSTAQLLSQADVVVRDIGGLHSGVNPTSGDFSVGADGNFVTGGEIGAPFDEATIASTLQRMLLSIVGIGAQAKVLAGGTVRYPLLIDDVALSGA